MARSFSSEILEQALQDSYLAAKKCTSGALPTYIPELATVNPDLFGVTICTADGRIFSVGDHSSPFTIQSSIKPFLFWNALALFGKDSVLDVVGVEPSSEPFDSFIKLDSNTHRPHNPMMNAGAIAISGLLANEGDPDRIINLVRAASGSSEISVDIPVFLSERDTADRNRAIGYLLKHFDILANDLEDTISFYLQACAISVTTRELSIMGATLANGGVCPMSGDSVLEGRFVREVLTVMMTCGIYQASGRLAHDVGVPAKSGVSGNIFMVVPGALSVCAFSPLLDTAGNSVRGFSVLRMLSESLGLHRFQSQQRFISIPQGKREAGNTFPIETGKVEASFHSAFARVKGEDGGRVAEYAPELLAVDPRLFEASLCFVSGKEISAGDSQTTFSLQAAANPFTYALALHRHGIKAVHEKVGVDPSGNRFDEIVFDPETRRPFNPLTNAGAITMCSLVEGNSASERLKTLLSWYSLLSGREEIKVHHGMNRSESRVGNRNRAIAYLLRNFGIIEDVEAALELYFQQCALQIRASDLARMAAVLANRGVCPFSGRVCIEEEYIKSILTVMYTCGMHDSSGAFAFHVGLPSKSGISGCVVGVSPGEFGIAVYSPQVDTFGSSVRGVAFLKALIDS
ncbi:MAG: glutaminase A [Bdellovibrionales bacterium]|nr:glutaminase A [Bdellovibrionales bacterium]